jgi:hypothetical protein
LGRAAAGGPLPRGQSSRPSSDSYMSASASSLESPCEGPGVALVGRELWCGGRATDEEKICGLLKHLRPPRARMLTHCYRRLSVKILSAVIQSARLSRRKTRPAIYSTGNTVPKGGKRDRVDMIAGRRNLPLSRYSRPAVCLFFRRLSESNAALAL